MLNSDLLRKVIDFIYKTWENEYGTLDVFDFFNSDFDKIAESAFFELTKNIKKENSEKHYLIRICGQSGSGKTTQLMPSIKVNLDNLKENYVLIAVRVFAKYHPCYNELLLKYGDKLIREKTNGFALTLLLKVLEKLIKNNYNILFEMTLLEPLFEEYIIKILKDYNYKICFNILSVSENLSDKWILKRQNKSLDEINRVVFKTSSSYFYRILPESLNKIIELSHLFDDNDYFILWNAFDENPLLKTSIFNDKILILFEKYRKILDIADFNETFLLESKIKFYRKFLKTFLI